MSVLSMNKTVDIWLHYPELGGSAHQHSIMTKFILFFRLPITLLMSHFIIYSLNFILFDESSYAHNKIHALVFICAWLIARCLSYAKS